MIIGDYISISMTAILNKKCLDATIMLRSPCSLVLKYALLLKV